MSKDYYKILEIERDATATDIKKAYHKLARIWHPDKNPDKLDEAKKRFQDISEAFQVLSNDNLRAQYDASLRFGGAGSLGGGFQHFNVNSDFFKSSDELFREFFGGKTLEEEFNDFLNDPLFADLKMASSSSTHYSHTYHDPATGSTTTTSTTVIISQPTRTTSNQPPVYNDQPQQHKEDEQKQKNKSEKKCCPC